MHIRQSFLFERSIVALNGGKISFARDLCFENGVACMAGLASVDSSCATSPRDFCGLSRLSVILKCVLVGLKRAGPRTPMLLYLSSSLHLSALSFVLM